MNKNIDLKKKVYKSKNLVLPNFFVAGCQKCATTSLHHYLIQHPDIYLPVQKETKHFVQDFLYNKGIKYYKDTYFSSVSGESAIGEVDPDYIYFEDALISCGNIREKIK